MKRLFFLSLFVLCSTELLAQNTLPNPKFTFIVNMGGFEGSFQEVSGLNEETQVIEYRSGNNKKSGKMPGIQKFGNVTLKRGIVKKDFIQLLESYKLNSNRMTLIIKMMDENGEPIMTWKLDNAWSTKISKTDFSSDESAIELVEIAHEGISVLK
jgi:phage tail-like protein